MRFAIATVVAAFALAAPIHGATVPTDPDARVLRVERWLRATLTHQPGAKDDAVDEVSLWSNAELRALFVDEGVLSQLMRNPALTHVKVPTNGGRRQPFPYTAWQVHRLRVLACEAAGSLDSGACMQLKAADDLDPALTRLAKVVSAAASRGDNTFVLRRGAILHGDIAMSGPAPVLAPDLGAPGETGRIRVTVADGESTGFGAASMHWEIARMLLDNVNAAPSDTFAQQWYVATAAWMQSREQHDTVHLRHAREMFPDDPDLLFLSGCQQETYASPAIQSVVRSAVLPQGFSVDVPSEATALRDAEAFFRRSLAQHPRHVEARMRLGHVLLARGRPQEAASELRQVVAPAGEPGLQYFTLMFLGAAEEALGRFNEAREAYARAAALEPQAQSPYLALSALATRRGDRSGALREIERLFALPPAVARRTTDPWWIYRVAQARNADTLIDHLYAPFAEAKQ